MNDPTYSVRHWKGEHASWLLVSFRWHFVFSPDAPLGNGINWLQIFWAKQIKWLNSVQMFYFASRFFPAFGCARLPRIFCSQSILTWLIHDLYLFPCIRFRFINNLQTQHMERSLKAENDGTNQLAKEFSVTTQQLGKPGTYNTQHKQIFAHCNMWTKYFIPFF